MSAIGREAEAAFEVLLDPRRDLVGWVDADKLIALAEVVIREIEFRVMDTRRWNGTRRRRFIYRPAMSQTAIMLAARNEKDGDK